MHTDSAVLTAALLIAVWLSPTLAAGQTGVASTPVDGCDASIRRIEVHANGAIRAAAVGESNEPAGTGSLGVGVSRGAKSFFAGINVASSVDTVSAGHGAFILSPAAGKALKSGVLDLHQGCGPFGTLARSFLGDGAGMHFYASAAETIWRDETDARTVGVFSAGALLYKNVADGVVGDDGDNKVRVKVEIGPSFRLLTGSARDTEERDFRDSLLGSASSVFAGIEAGLQLRYGVVTGALQFYWYDDFWANARAAGITGGQLVAFVGVGGPVFSGNLK